MQTPCKAFNTATAVDSEYKKINSYFIYRHITFYARTSNFLLTYF